MHEALAVLAEGRYAAEVEEEIGLWRGRGISAVPAVVVEAKWMISGGQPASVFEEALGGMAGRGE